MENFKAKVDQKVEDKAKVEKEVKHNFMDKANAEMYKVMLTQGPEVGAKAMIDDCGGNYAAMRARYG